MEFKKIGVLGASTMGAGLVQHIANCGFEVVFRARKQTSVDSALKYIEGQYEFMISKGWLEESKKAESNPRRNKSHGGGMLSGTYSPR